MTRWTRLGVACERAIIPVGIILSASNTYATIMRFGLGIAKTEIFLVFVNPLESVVRVMHVLFIGGRKQDSLSWDLLLWYPVW